MDKFLLCIFFVVVNYEYAIRLLNNLVLIYKSSKTDL